MKKYFVKESTSRDFALGEILTISHGCRKGYTVHYADGDCLQVWAGKKIRHNQGLDIWNDANVFLAELQPVSEIMSDEDVIRLMTDRPMVSSFYIQNGELPTTTQGWKMHVSANSFADYCYKLSILIPALKKAGVCYKVLRPSMYGKQGTLQHGKFITIYLDRLPKLSEQAKEVIFCGTSYPVQGEKKIGGSAYVRYGSFTGHHVWCDQTQSWWPDVRGQYKPSFVADPDWATLF